MLVGIISLLLVTAMLAIALGLAFYGGQWRAAALRGARRVHLVRPEPPRPTGPPLDRLARDVRRLHEENRHPFPGEPMARRRAVAAAYDDALVAACRALDLPDTLSMLPEGTDREAERLRVEHLLAQSGLVVHRDESA